MLIKLLNFNVSKIHHQVVPTYFAVWDVFAPGANSYCRGWHYPPEDLTQETGAPTRSSYRDAKLEPATLELKDISVISCSAGRCGPLTGVRVQDARPEWIERNWKRGYIGECTRKTLAKRRIKIIFADNWSVCPFPCKELQTSVTVSSGEK